jgi:hypothetical protein
MVLVVIWNIRLGCDILCLLDSSTQSYIFNRWHKLLNRILNLMHIMDIEITNILIFKSWILLIYNPSEAKYVLTVIFISRRCACMLTYAVCNTIFWNVVWFSACFVLKRCNRSEEVTCNQNQWSIRSKLRFMSVWLIVCIMLYMNTLITFFKHFPSQIYIYINIHCKQLLWEPVQ